jgi:hypothetical protein
MVSIIATEIWTTHCCTLPLGCLQKWIRTFVLTVMNLPHSSGCSLVHNTNCRTMYRRNSADDVLRWNVLRRIDQSTSIISFKGCGPPFWVRRKRELFFGTQHSSSSAPRGFFLKGDQHLETDLHWSCCGIRFWRKHNTTCFTSIKSNYTP